MESKIITFGIPAYNAHETIEKTIVSLIHQSEIDKIKVVIANDKSKKGYESIVKKYKSFIDISVIDLKKNVGPGFARQAVLDQCDTEFISFIDADDVLVDYYFVGFALQALSDPMCITYISQFEEKVNGNYQEHHTSNNWMFGKVYKVSMLREKGIKFTLSRSHEDIEFNQKIRLTLEEEKGEYIYFTNRITYLWQENTNSITRKNDGDYSYLKGPLGSIDAISRSFDFSVKYFNEIKPYLKHHIVSSFFMFYTMYNVTANHRPKHKTKVFNKIKVFYQKYAKLYLPEFHDKEKAMFLNDAANQAGDWILPVVTYHQFIELLEGE